MSFRFARIVLFFSIVAIGPLLCYAPHADFGLLEIAAALVLVGLTAIFFVVSGGRSHPGMDSSGIQLIVDLVGIRHEDHGWLLLVGLCCLFLGAGGIALILS